MRHHLSGKKLGVVIYVCNPSVRGKQKIGGSLSRPVWAKNEILSPKLPGQKWLEVWLKQWSTAL
jgi:hypothetical protein